MDRGVTVRKSSERRIAKSIDAHVGVRIRERRRDLAVGRGQLADALGLSSEQMRRYEAGSATVVASRLHEIGSALGVPAGYFLEGVERVGDARGSRADPPRDGRSFPTARELTSVVEAYWRIGNPDVRRQLLALVVSVAGSFIDGFPPAGAE